MSVEAWFWCVYGVVAVLGVVYGLTWVIKAGGDREEERIGAQITCLSPLWPIALCVAVFLGILWLLITAFSKED